MNKKPSGRASSMVGGISGGLMWSACITAVLAALSAKMVDLEWIGEKDIGYCAMVILITASFAGSNIAWKKIKRQRLLVCVLSGSLYFLVLMGMTALFFGGQYEAVGVTFLLVICGTSLVLLGGERKNRGGKRLKRKVYNC